MPDEPANAQVARMHEIFGLGTRLAASAVRRIAEQPPHMLDEALCFTARRPGEAFSDIEAMATGDEASLMARATLVSYKVIRALRSIQSPRDFSFASEEDADLAAMMPSEPAEDPVVRATEESEALRRIGAAGRFVMNSTQLVVPGATGSTAVVDCHTTTGLSVRGLPELICFMVPREVARGVLHNVADHLARPAPSAYGRRIQGIVEAGDIVLLRVFQADVAARFPATTRILGGAFRGAQVVFSDRLNRLPWEQGCDPGVAFSQPVCGAVPGRRSH